MFFFLTIKNGIYINIKQAVLIAQVVPQRLLKIHSVYQVKQKPTIISRCPNIEKGSTTTYQYQT